MHAIHTTPGFIVGSNQYGEADKLISIFTRDMGLVRAVAQGIRLERSKLRYHSNDYSFGVFSLVRGKEVWRLTSAQSGSIGAQSSVGTQNSSIELSGDVAAVQAFWARIALLLRRFLQGEEANTQLFEVIESCHIFLNTVLSQSTNNLDAIESLVVIRIMHALGYIGDNKEIHSFIYSNDLTLGVCELAMSKKTLINQHINKALKESHL